MSAKKLVRIEYDSSKLKYPYSVSYSVGLHGCVDKIKQKIDSINEKFGLMTVTNIQSEGKVVSIRLTNTFNNKEEMYDFGNYILKIFSKIGLFYLYGRVECFDSLIYLIEA